MIRLKGRTLAQGSKSIEHQTNKSVHDTGAEGSWGGGNEGELIYLRTHIVQR